MRMISKKPGKQRKFRFTAKLHLRRKMVSVHTSKELRSKLSTKRRSVIVHKGDRVQVMRGQRRGHAGRVLEVDLSTLQVYVEGVTQRNAKGVEQLAPIDPSNLLLLDGEFAKDRLAMIQRSGKSAKKQ